MAAEKTLKAGAIIVSANDKNKIALLHRGKQNDWSFPKGHVDSGENATETMVREIKEETGLNVNILEELPNMEYPHITEGVVSTKMFLVESMDDSLLKLEFENDSIEWVPSNEIISRLSYDNLKDYFKLVEPIVQKIIVSK